MWIDLSISDVVSTTVGSKDSGMCATNMTLDSVTIEHIQITSSATKGCQTKISREWNSKSDSTKTRVIRPRIDKEKTRKLLGIKKSFIRKYSTIGKRLRKIEVCVDGTSKEWRGRNDRTPALLVPSDGKETTNDIGTRKPRGFLESRWSRHREYYELHNRLEIPTC